MSNYSRNAVEPHVIGQAFENYVREKLFVIKDYELLDHSPTFTKRKEHFALSALKPDFKFRDRKTNKQFYIEVKFRTQYAKSNEIKWSYEKQLSRYRSFNRECPTFLLLGIRMNGNHTMIIGLIPIEKAAYTSLFIMTIKKFQILANEPISPDNLWSKLEPG